MKVRLMWDASPSVDVECYSIFANDEFLGSVPHTGEKSYEYKAILPGEHYSFGVIAIDSIGRQSTSQIVTVREQAVEDPRYKWPVSRLIAEIQDLEVSLAEKMRQPVGRKG